MEDKWETSAVRFDMPRLQWWPLGLHRAVARSKGKAVTVKRLVLVACAMILILGSASWIMTLRHWRVMGVILVIVALSSIAAVQWLWWRSEWCSICGTCIKSPFSSSRTLWCPGCYNLNDPAQIRLAQSKIIDLTEPKYLYHHDPIVRFVAITLLLAACERATQLRFEASKNEFRVVITVHDEDHELMPPPLFVALPSVQAAMAMAGLDVSKAGQPQEGAFHVRVRSHIMSTRVVMQPTSVGRTVAFQWDR